MLYDLQIITKLLNAKRFVVCYLCCLNCMSNSPLNDKIIMSVIVYFVKKKQNKQIVFQNGRRRVESFPYFYKKFSQQVANSTLYM